MSDTLPEHKSFHIGKEHCNECFGYPHAPWCSKYESDKEVSGTFQQSRTAKYPAKVLAELTAAGEINNEQYQRLRRETVDDDHEPAARGGGEWHADESSGWGYIWQGGACLAKCPEPSRAQQIVTEHNQHHSLVAERELLRGLLQQIFTEFLSQGRFDNDLYAIGFRQRIRVTLNEQRSTPQ